MRRLALAFAAGALFALGLGVSGMSDPFVVLAFLDVAGGTWDPALMLVMAGALAVHGPVVRFARSRPRPWQGDGFDWPPRTTLDRRLIAGAAVFGVGWGLAGYCPGPALVGVASLMPRTVVFVAALIAGAMVARGIDQKK